MKNVKRYLVKMDRAVNYDYYYDDELRKFCFKSPFDHRLLLGRRMRHMKNEGKRTLRLVGSSTADYMRQCEEDAVADFDGDDREDEV